MQVIEMKIADLRFPEKNVRIHTESQIKEFIRSIDKFEQIRPVVIDENNTILCGNGLVEAMKRLGRETVFVHQKKNLSENDKKKLMIADNKIFGLGIDNLDVINSFFEELKDDLDIPGFDDEILKSMVADADVVTQKLSEYGTLDDEEIEIIRENGKRREEQIAEIQKEKASEDSADEVQVKQNTAPQPETETPAGSKFVVCPKCGEKIWL